MALFRNDAPLAVLVILMIALSASVFVAALRAWWRAESDGHGGDAAPSDD